MHKKTIGLLIVLGLSNSLAMAQEFAVPKGKVVEDEVLAVRNSEDAKDRPEVTMSPVISDILVKGGNMHLTLRFWVDSDQIKGQAHKQILEIATALNNPGLIGKRIGVEGHTDADGAEDYNLDLSYRRSVTVVRTLIQKYGIEPKRLEVMAFGESRPVAGNDTGRGKALNRRVTLVNLDYEDERKRSEGLFGSRKPTEDRRVLRSSQ